jgi:S1-C subfamily serine protease
LEISRNGNRQTLDVALDEMKDDPTRADKAPSGRSGSDAPAGLGIEIGESPNRKGEVIVGNVEAGSPADGRLVPGDVILEVNNVPVHKPEEVAARTKSTPSGSPVLLKIKRDGKTRYVAIERVATN